MIKPMLAALAVPFLATSCMTTYDAHGNPVQSVDPAAAAVGVVTAAAIGYALADDNDNHYYYRRPAPRPAPRPRPPRW
ncbi:MAG: hypothetical protein ACQKBU_02205 [Verrucomicrobiales bacterium]